jgi:CelD/BcsL family acetyltransferase involved in cellulose biosynthesis
MRECSELRRTEVDHRAHALTPSQTPVRQITVESLSSQSQIESLEPIWNALLARSGSDSIFLTYEWITSWMRWIGRDTRPCVLVAREQDVTIIGLAPLMITSAVGPTGTTGLVQFIGTPNSDYSDFIIEGQREPVLRAFFRHLLRARREWDRISLQEFPEHSPSRSALHQLSRKATFPLVQAPGELCSTLILDGREEEIKRELARKKYIGKRNWEKSVAYAEKFGAVSFRHAATLQDAEAWLPDLFRLHRQRWAGTSKFLDDAYESLYRELLETLWPKGQVAVTAMTLNEKPVAMSFAFPYKQAWTNHTWVHDHNAGKFSPGTLLIHYMVLQAIEQGYKEFDLTRGAEAYKERFSNQVRQNTNLTIYGKRRDYVDVKVRHLAHRGRGRIAQLPRLHHAVRTIRRGLDRTGSD